MFPVFRSLSLRYLRLRWVRALLVVVSIALGVATLVSTRILNQCLDAAAHDTMTPIAMADLYASNGEIGVTRDTADDIRRAQIPGVEAVVPMVFEQARMLEFGGDGRIVLLVGADLSEINRIKRDEKKALRPRVINPAAFFFGKGIVISETLHKERLAAGIGDNEPVRLHYADRVVEFYLGGVLVSDTEGQSSSFERNLVGVELDAALELLLLDRTKGERVTRIDIFTAKGANLSEVQAALQAAVGEKAAVKTLEDQKKSTDDIVSGVKIAFELTSFGALIVGLFLVYNALSVSVAERRHDIGILRSIGATRFQVARLFAGEAMLLGAVGAILGIPLGTFLAETAINLVKDDLNAVFLNPDIRPMKPKTVEMIWAVIAGMLTTLLAALVPAIEAANDEPADAVRRAPSVKNRFFRFAHRAACVLMFFGGFAMILVRDDLPERLGSYLGLSAMLLGLFLSMPILVGWMARLLQPFFRWTLGVEARLAADNLIRSPARTGVVIGALAAGVALMFQTAGVGRSNEEPIKAWVEQVIQADAFVFSGSVSSANSSLSPMNPKVGKEIEKVEGVERVVGLRFVRPDYKDTIVCVVAMDADNYFRGTRSRLPQGLPDLETFEQLPKGNFIVVSENFAIKFKVKKGDVVTLPRLRGGPVKLTVIGIGVDYTWSKGTLFIDRKKYVELFDDDYVDTYHVFFAPDADKVETRQKVEAAVAPYKLVVEDKAFVREFLAGVIDKIYKIAYLQQFIVGVVAALGVVTALLISVLQRRRELGLLRAVGATQLQVLKSVLAEAFLMGVIGTILGILVGLPMEWYLLRVVLVEESGFVFPMIIPWKEALGIGAIAIGIATLAGLIPALHAVRLRIVDAIAYE
jgi:putative ABC transport system permease protein